MLPLFGFQTRFWKPGAGVWKQPRSTNNAVIRHKAQELDEPRPDRQEENLCFIGSSQPGGVVPTAVFCTLTSDRGSSRRHCPVDSCGYPPRCGVRSTEKV